MTKDSFFSEKSRDAQELFDILRRTFTSIISDAIEQAIGNLVVKEVIPPVDHTKNPKKPQDEMWTIDEFCSYVHISRPTFHAMVNRGVIHIQKCGQRTLVSSAEVKTKLSTGELGKYKRTTK